jgi:anti-anti-sigma regulatory factor
MLRIETVDTGKTERTIRATGRLAGPWVEELRRSLESEANTSVVLDLTEVSFVDRDGIAWLRMLSQNTQVLLRCSAFVHAQLM